MKFTPVIMGANRGAFGLARVFYEKYGVKTIIISPFQTGPVRHSRILEFYKQTDMQDVATLVQTMTKIARDYPDTKKKIFGSDDRYVELLIKNRLHFRGIGLCRMQTTTRIWLSRIKRIFTICVKG